VRLLVENVDVIATMDDADREIRNGAIATHDDSIAFVGTGAEYNAWIAANPECRADRTINAAGCVALPGLVNGHHHMYQSLTRTIATSGGMSLFEFLRKLYPVWRRINPEAVYVSAKLTLSGLIQSGVTTVVDHLYMFPNGVRLDDEILAARELGVRFHPTRGAMSMGESDGGLPPDYLVEEEDDVLADCVRVIGRFHDPGPRSMLRIGLAPCSLFSVTSDLMRDTARLARRHERVGLHAHLSETMEETRYCVEKWKLRPLEYAESLEWLAEDIWFAHLVHPSEPEIQKLAHARTGVCHCPTSSMNLGMGIAPVRSMLDAGVRVGLGVDGSASNDDNNLLNEVRQAMLLQRVGWPGFEAPTGRMSAREALRLATRGGAAMLGRDDIGSIEVGKAADLVAFRVDDAEHSGSQSDPVAALVTCARSNVWLSIINGRPVVEKGELLNVDVPRLVARHNEMCVDLLRQSGLMR
jgi:8-oxoguanine deaminase